jgi:hypothetical protein
LKPYIKLKDCKDGYTYRVEAHNGQVGIFCKESSWFELSKIKFGKNYIFEEFHYDVGAPFGSVLPIYEIEKAPIFENDKVKLEYLNNLTKLL